MTKVKCGCIKCKYNSKGICKAKEISLAHDSVLTVYNGRREYNVCTAQEDSEEYKELIRKMESYYANNSK